ncbi:MAG: DUF3048 domain-containing protein [Anaerolineae bacterium]|nr:DUF3048 domain-containing protein [Anaerolineae bacterium]
MQKTHVHSGIIVLFALAACFIILAAQAQDNIPNPSTEATEETIIEEATSQAYPVVEGAIGPTIYADNINPLTGLLVDNIAQLNRRPIIVKISNSPAIVRPQAGLNAADLVFEHYTEVGITRFSAIFYTNAPQRVGSIRSARLIDTELMPMYQGLLAFAGASIGVDKRIYGSETIIENLCRNRDDIEQCRVEADAIGPGWVSATVRFCKSCLQGRAIWRTVFLS